MLPPASRVFACMNTEQPNTPDEAGLDDPVVAAALDWFVRLRDSSLGTEERQAFERWRDADPAHAAALAEVEALWTDMDAVPAPAPLPRAWTEPFVRAEQPRRSWRLWIGAAAASLALFLIAPQLWLMAVADIRTGTGQFRNVTLADGTRVSLDADSAIAADMDADSRHVRLLKGRAWFAVAHEARPFTVAVGAGQVRDIGTAFEVTRRDEGGEIDVTQGVVELTTARDHAFRLEKGQSARFNADGTIRLVQASPIPAAWRNGRLQFVDEPLGNVLSDLARYGAGAPLMLPDELADRRLTGAVDLGDPVAARDAVLARVGSRALGMGPWFIVKRK